MLYEDEDFVILNISQEPTQPPSEPEPEEEPEEESEEEPEQKPESEISMDVSGTLSLQAGKDINNSIVSVISNFKDYCHTRF